MDPSLLKYWLWPPLLLIALWWLVHGGRGKTPYPRRVFLGAITLTVLLFGFLLGTSPNPLEAIVQIFPGAGRDGSRGLGYLVLAYFSVLAVVGTKLVCGWGCPFGALQELLYEVPLFRALKKNQLPFLVTMFVRTMVFVLFLLVLFGWLGGHPGKVLYRYIDPFQLFDFNFVLVTVTGTLLFLLVLSLLVYRPFCQILCPFGWYSWFLERFSLYGIRINRRRCSRCNACARACPLEAARSRLEGWPLAADCFSCARCLRVCPGAAIDYGLRWRLGRGTGALQKK